MTKANKQFDCADPFNLATRFLASGYVWKDGDKPCYTLRRWKQEYYLYEAGRYIKQADDTVCQRIASWLQCYAQEKASESLTVSITRGLILNVKLNIDALIHVPENQQLNSFINANTSGRFLCMQNGLLNLESRELIKHSPDFFTTVQLPYDFDRDADCPAWKAFLQEVTLNRQDYINMIQEFIGYLFRPDLREQKFLLCVGEGANGKGVLFDVTQFLVGAENCSQVPISRFGDRFALTSTIGKVCNFTNESSHILEDEAENILKSYVSGDGLTIDRKYREPIEFRPTAKLMIATNNLPRFNDKTQAVWRRILLVPFDLTIKRENQDKEKAEQLKKELPGILNWSLQGLDRLNTQGFTEPKGNDELMESYRRDSDPARAFLMENYTVSPNGEFVPCGDIYRAYKDFCENNGCHAMNERHFGQQIKRLFPNAERQRIGTRDCREYVYKGLVSHVS